MRRQEAVFVWASGGAGNGVPKPSTHRIACTELWTQTWDSSLVRPLQQEKTPYHMGQFLFQLTRQSSPMPTKKFSSSTLVWPHSSPPIAATRGTFTVLGLKTPRRTCYTSASSSNRHLPHIRLRPKRLTRTRIEETGRGNGRAPAVSLGSWRGRGTGLGRGGRGGGSLRLSCSSTSSFRIKRL